MRGLELLYREREGEGVGVGRGEKRELLAHLT